MDAGFEYAKEGSLCEDIVIAFFDTLHKSGINKENRLDIQLGQVILLTGVREQFFFVKVTKRLC